MGIPEGSSILITGGTGSFGRAILSEILKNHSPARVAIFSRDELKKCEMKLSWDDGPRVRFYLGDIRDRDRLRMALHGVEYAVHAAALKQVDTAENNPMEYVKTNILGSENVMVASIEASVKTVVTLWSDKASYPVNFYGATKLTADTFFVSGNHQSHSSAPPLHWFATGMSWEAGSPLFFSSVVWLKLASPFPLQSAT